MYYHEGGDNTALSTCKWPPAVPQAGAILLEEIEFFSLKYWPYYAKITFFWGGGGIRKIETRNQKTGKNKSIKYLFPKSLVKRGSQHFFFS